jgi:AmmeMemoRadiSam system protein B
MTLRRAAVAGTWYPATAARLSAQVAEYVGDSHEEVHAEDRDALPPDADVIALVAPHAGLMYSGPVAAYGYRLLQSREYETIVLVGPSHYVGFEGASIWASGAFETPLGNLTVDEKTAAAIVARCPVLEEIPAAHEREHSLEMQLPFLAAFAPATPIVPIVMGFQTRETSFTLGDGTAAALRGRRALLVASSDLSHFYDADTAASLDQRVIAQVNALDDEGLMTLLEQRSDHACGGGPMVSVLRAARLLGANRSRVLRYADSGDISGDKASVVGYMAAAVWR